MKSFKFLLVLLFSMTLAACGGGGSSSTSAPTFSISGTVSGSVTSGVTITLSGASSSSTVTAAGGTYTFTGLSNGNYTVTPSISGHVFSPSSTAVTVNGADVTGTNFVATANAGGITYTISGTVSGAATSGVTITLSGDNSGSVITGAGGTYSFPGLLAGNYTVTPSLSGYSFSPTSTPVTLVAADSTGNDFTATLITYNISGTVSGDATSGVTINLTGDSTGSTVTGVGGTYTFASIAPGNYTLTPVLAGHTFSPTSKAVTLGAADSTANDFTATLTTYSISGAVSGSVTSGVTINLTGDSTGSTVTAAGGTYSFASLVPGNYTVTPSLAGYNFSPTNIAVTLASANSASNNFTSTVASVPTYTLSGTITGPIVGGVTVTLGGDSSGTFTTASDGTYSFPGLVAGTYTVTPSLPGYTYSPASPTVALSTNTVQDFTASSAIASSTVSGTLTYAGAKTGPITVRVLDQGCPNPNNCTIIGAIRIPAQAGAFSLAYQIRGVPTGNYVVKAGFNTVGTGASNIANPSGASTNISTTAGVDNTGVDITITDPGTIAAPATPTNVAVFPSDQSVLVFYDAPTNANGAEKADTYKIYWSSDPGFTTGLGSQTYTAQGTNQNAYIVSGLTNGTMYFKMTAINHDTGGTLVESAATSVIGPIPVGATTGSNTVSGTVTYTGTATGPLLVGMYDTTNNMVYYTTIASPSSPQSFSISGVPNGAAYFNFAIIDNNNNGRIDTGDINNIDDSGAGLVTVSGNTTSNVTLTSDSSYVKALTQHYFDGSNSYYNMILGARDGVKKVSALILLSGPNVAVPRDLDMTSGNDTWVFLNTTSPTPGDEYRYKVVYSDTTNEIKTATVSAVLSTSNMAQNLNAVTDGTGGSSAGIPYFTWSAPASPLGSYTYHLNLSGGSVNWDYPQDGALPSSTLNALYDSTALSAGSYNWNVTVVDANGNLATRSATTLTIP